MCSQEDALHVVQSMAMFGTLRVGDKVGFVYPTKAGNRPQGILDKKHPGFGRILPCYPENPDSGVIGEARTNQLSQGTGERFEPFLRITVGWGRKWATFNVSKIVASSFVKG